MSGAAFLSRFVSSLISLAAQPQLPLMFFVPVVGSEIMVIGVGVVTGPVTVLSGEISPASPTTIRLGATPDIESAKVITTLLLMLVTWPRQLYVIVIGVEDGLISVVDGGNL